MKESMYSPLAPGTILFNRYEVVGLAGQSEFGLSYLARDQKRFQELSMLQEFAPLQTGSEHLEALRQRFHQEAAILYQIQHFQLPHYQIMFGQGERLYLARNYISGKSYSAMLNERRADGRAFSQTEILYLFTQTLPVLGWLHRAGLVHQNLSPSSIVIRQPDQLPVLIDFGLIKRWVAKLHLHPVLPGVLIGAEGYAPPEQEAEALPVPAWDLYALGMTAIALLLGKPANEFGPQGVRSLPWEAYVTLHPDLTQILKRLVHPNPKKRFVSCGQVMKALQAVAPSLLYPSPQPVELPRTAAVPPAPTHPTGGQPSAAPPSPETRTRRQTERPSWFKWASADVRSSAVLVTSVAVLVAVISFKALSWVQTEPLQETPTATRAPTEAANLGNGASKPTTGEPSPTPTLQMPTREPPAGGSPAGGSPTGGSPAGVDGAGTGADLNPQWVSNLTDDLFYTKHPELQGQKLSEDASQQALRQEWEALYNEVSAKLGQLSPSVRQQLGNYQREDYDRWIAPESGASLNERELNVLVNQRFGELFPEQKGKTLNPETFGQVWYAIADEELTKLKPKPDS